MYTFVTILLFCIVACNAQQEHPTLIVFERDINDENALIARYSWDPAFNRVILANFPQNISTVTFSAKTQTLYLFVDDFNAVSHTQTLFTYDLQTTMLNMDIVQNVNFPFVAAVYFESTDELWTLCSIEDEPTQVGVCRLNVFDGKYYQNCAFKKTAPPDIKNYAYSTNDQIYLGPDGWELWTLNVDTNQILIDTFVELDRAGHLAFNPNDQQIYFSVPARYNVLDLASINPITRQSNKYFNQFPQFSKNVAGCTPSMIDDHYVSSLLLPWGGGMVLSFSKPGGDNFFQPINNKAVWVWKWPVPVINGTVVTK